MNNSHYTVTRTAEGAVFLIDLCMGGATVTNDAERVVAELLRVYGGSRKFFYLDSDRRWGVLEHDGLKFAGFDEPTDAERSGFNMVDGSQGEWP